ncbi:MAG TPA: hypothetical protein VJP59_07575, partial [Gemmatimonadota bacterium]|nr:hypothetical protein [Gemmatimonadota bacterium]
MPERATPRRPVLVRRGLLVLLPCALAVSAGVGSVSAQIPDTIGLEAGMVIDRSVRVRPGTYILPVPADSAAIVIRGDSIDADFR